MPGEVYGFSATLLAGGSSRAAAKDYREVSGKTGVMGKYDGAFTALPTLRERSAGMAADRGAPPKGVW